MKGIYLFIFWRNYLFIVERRGILFKASPIRLVESQNGKKLKEEIKREFTLQCTNLANI